MFTRIYGFFTAILVVFLFSGSARAVDDYRSVFDKWLFACEKRKEAIYRYEQEVSKCRNAYNRDQCYKNISLQDSNKYWSAITDMAIPMLNKNKSKLSDIDILDIKRCSGMVSNEGASGIRNIEILGRNGWFD